MGACKKKRCNHDSEPSKKGGFPRKGSPGILRAGGSSVEDDDRDFKIAIPLREGVLSLHLSQYEEFAVFTVANGEIQNKSLLVPPFREIEVAPRWLKGLRVGLFISGTMSERVFSLFARQNIDVMMGAASLPPDDLIRQYLAGALVTEPIASADTDLLPNALAWETTTEDDARE